MTARVVLYVGLCLSVHMYALADTAKDQKQCSKDGSSDYYFAPDERYATKPFLIKTLRPGRVVEDRYSPQGVEHSLRPINSRVIVPSNFLQSIQRPCALPHARQFWDLVFVEALLPSYAPRTKENERLFAEGESLDRITLRIGSLGAETAHIRLEREYKAGRLSIVAQHSGLGLVEYRDLKREDEPLRPSYFLANRDEVVTLNGNPLVIWCYGNRSERHSDELRCDVAITIPREYWAPKQRELFGGVQGLELRYYFYKKHLSEWHSIYRQVYRMADDYLADVTLPTPNSLLQPTHKARAAEQRR